MRKAFGAICLLLAGCFGSSPVTSPQAPSPSPTFTRQAVLAATPTQAPVAFVLPTATPFPTATPEPPSCAEPSGEYLIQTGELVKEWNDAVKLAQHTPRIQLGDQIDRLQKLRRRAEELPAPGCAIQSRLVLASAMRSEVSGLMDFLSQHISGSASSVIPTETSAAVEAAQHAMSALVEIPVTWQPLNREDVEHLFPQYEWKEKTFRDGDTAIEASIPPVTVQVFYENGIVYAIRVGAVISDPKEYSAAWQIIAPIASALLPHWENRNTWLAEFGAEEMGDTGSSKVERIDVTTVDASHIRLRASGVELASVVIYVPRRR